MLLVRARFDVLTTVRQRFYTALAMQQRVEVLERMVGIAATAHEVGERLLRAEIGTRGDVLLLEIELAKAQAELRNARTLAETSRRQLAAATGPVDLQSPRVAADFKQALPDYELLAVQHGVIEERAMRRAESPWPNRSSAAKGRGRAISQPEHHGRLPEPAHRRQHTREPGHPPGNATRLWNRNQAIFAAASRRAPPSPNSTTRTELANSTAAATDATDRGNSLLLAPRSCPANQVKHYRAAHEQGQVDFSATWSQTARRRQPVVSTREAR
jgi:hypothetical protein